MSYPSRDRLQEDGSHIERKDEEFTFKKLIDVGNRRLRQQVGFKTYSPHMISTLRAKDWGGWQCGCAPTDLIVHQYRHPGTYFYFYMNKDSGVNMRSLDVVNDNGQYEVNTSRSNANFDQTPTLS